MQWRRARGSHRGWSSSARPLSSIRVVLGLALVVGTAAGCGGSGSSASTEPTPPDRLAVSAEGGDIGSFSVDLDCAIADRATCAEVLRAVGTADDPEQCVPADSGDESLTVEGTIEGARVRALLRRRTDCEARAYDRVARAIGL